MTPLGDFIQYGARLSGWLLVTGETMRTMTDWRDAQNLSLSVEGWGWRVRGQTLAAAFTAVHQAGKQIVPIPEVRSAHQALVRCVGRIAGQVSNLVRRITGTTFSQKDVAEIAAVLRTLGEEFGRYMELARELQAALQAVADREGAP